MNQTAPHSAIRSFPHSVIRLFGNSVIRLFGNSVIQFNQGFTLIELLIVIGIIGILAGTLMGYYPGIIARVRATKCQTNLKNLANAVGTYAMEGRYPFAESAQATSASGERIYEVKGWLSWLSADTKFPIKGQSPASVQHCSYASGNHDEVLFALTNGAIWTAVGKNRASYLCPEHVDACRLKRVMDPGWSYQMNAWFGYEERPGQADALWDPRYTTGNLGRADRRLLFAEIPALDSSLPHVKKMMSKCGVQQLPPVNLTGGNNDDAMCGCLKYHSLGAGTTGSIGFNHLRGRDIVGHVAFADGHVETLVAPRNGDYNNLTDWLCQGLDVIIKNKSYQKLSDSEK